MLFRVVMLFLLFSFMQTSQASVPLVDSQGDEIPSLAPMLKQINPGVVNISTFSKRDMQNPLLNDPFFRRFFNIPDPGPQQNVPQRRQQSAGSGVIVDVEAGTIVTNYHVVKDADEIHVGLTDGRSLEAKLIGSDPEVDIAILKVKDKNLTAIKFSNSDILEVGDYVVAIGNPFGLGQTVTTGIVSALGRTGLGIEGFENFIQTDASINPGNSGGALVNLRGELVGINTAILAPAGGNVGIGFAIPANMVKISLDQILKNGEVRRGQIGISIQDLTPDLKLAFNLPSDQQGVLVSLVAPDSPAAEAGLLSGDIIVAIDDIETRSAGQLRNQIGMHEIGDKVKLSVIRDGKELNVKVKVGKPQDIDSATSGIHRLLEGAQFEENAQGEGIVVTNIAPNSPAAYNGLRIGDIIISANKIKVKTIKDLRQALAKDDSKILLQIQRGFASLFLVIQ